ncbi:hypothetical protein FXO38_10310 [Capsicum annuum]|uniref:Protein kinase domain-containing protein n=1 Tax=Capsicum annuum TaxID=4072 RepID=A0A2G3AFH2_CAPAN|nr:hypothetical protein FXO38_10310 [Capsicum annuum]PHT92986.1 hypothetical protein T459_00868 [Capsicum annuum]
MKIAEGAAKGLKHLHETANPSVIYYDFKASNILLDENFNPKLSDFGLAKLGPTGDKTHVSARVMGTYGNAIVQRQQEVSLNGGSIDGRGLPDEGIVPSTSNSSNVLARGSQHTPLMSDMVTALEFLSGNRKELDAENKDEYEGAKEKASQEMTFKSPPALQSFTSRLERAEIKDTNDVRERD